MSYRELRNFAEILRVLGYSRLVSVENFRKPNFPLIAEILQWLTLRYDPTLELSIDIETEQDRVIFIKTSAQLIVSEPNFDETNTILYFHLILLFFIYFCATKAHIKLNTKKLYLADGHAVQELLKMASLLYEAAKSSEVIEENATFSENQALTDSTLIVKKSELKKCRQIASEITQKGVNLYDSLMKEMELREQRNNVLSRQLKIAQVETGLKNAITDLEKLIETVNNKIDNVASDEANLDSKIEKKQSELLRYQKRLQTLKSIRQYLKESSFENFVQFHMAIILQEPTVDSVFTICDRVY
ncbi:clusterin-associated protein 1-like protein [Leptotrombidium deliense]|uniref:Clusterin-associated protein 1-like protein n=1 Tax=Leptotrombidium deliense TaxID=299467 RepID=A0A443SN35_9ACAR|nr:clusterin-associated protein 1-like protein [Leptotrombidium deliense]